MDIEIIVLSITVVTLQKLIIGEGDVTTHIFVCSRDSCLEFKKGKYEEVKKGKSSD